MTATHHRALEGRTLSSPVATCPQPARWWSAEAVSTLITLGAIRRITADRGQTYPVIDWTTGAPDGTVELCAYEEPNDGQWVWVVEAGIDSKGGAGLRFDGDITFTTMDEDAAYQRIAALLNWFDHRSCCGSL